MVVYFCIIGIQFICSVRTRSLNEDLNQKEKSINLWLIAAAQFLGHHESFTYWWRLETAACMVFVRDFETAGVHKLVCWHLHCHTFLKYCHVFAVEFVSM